MKTDKEINVIIKQELENYAKAETKSEVTDIKFSKEHEEKMKKMFNEMKKNAKQQDDDRELVIRIKFGIVTKVAIALIIFAIFTSAVSTGLKAWKEHKLEKYGGNEEYSWLLSNDTSEIYEEKSNTEDIKYVRDIFPNLSGEISDVKIMMFTGATRIEFLYEGEKVVFNINKTWDIAKDNEVENFERIVLDNTIVYYMQKDGRHTYMWNYNKYNFTLYGNDSWNNKFFEEINYEKIETNF